MTLRVLRSSLAAAALALSAVACGEDGQPPRGPEERTAAVLEARAQGLAYLQEDRLEEARREFRRLAELAPEEGTGPANLALVALRRGDHERAERLAREALDREPEDPWIHLILARSLEAAGRSEAARASRERALELDPGNRRALWTLAGGSSEGREPPPAGDRRIRLLSRLLDRSPASLPPRLELIEALLVRGEAAAAAAGLEELRSLAPELSDRGGRLLERALDRAREEELREARAAAARLHEWMRLLPEYRADVEELEGPRGEATGFPYLSFSHELSLQVPDEAAVLAAVRFSDATEFAGLGEVGEDGGRGGRSVVAPGDADGDRDVDLFVQRAGADGGPRTRLLRNELGSFVDATPPALRRIGPATSATWADVDGDGRVDLFVAAEGRNHLFLGTGDGSVEEAEEASGLATAGDGRVALFVDLDHDGDLDLFASEDQGVVVYRNRGDGRFERVDDAMGLEDVEARVHDAAFADVDDDGDLDLVTARGPAGVSLHANLRQGRFATVDDSLGLDRGPAAEAVAVGDYDNDGWPDLAVTAEGTPPALLRNDAGEDFRRDRRSEAVLSGDGGADVVFLDFDNDGHLDLFLPGRAGTGRAALLHNDGDGRFTDRSDHHLPDDVAPGAAASVFDYNEDGDLDLLIEGARGARLLRNDGGNGNHHFDLRLVARGPGSGKVNRFGVGSKVEVRADSLYQLRTVRGPNTHFGLGRRLKADVVRIVWTNGVPQYLYFPGTDQELIESQELKGSCAFVYAWDGEGYRFVTDAVWRSALGMPVGIMAGPGGDTRRAYAPAAASREYVRIPGDRLAARDGRYRLQLTEELWEVAYLDEVRLLAVDHPDSVDLFVDERFVPPGPTRLELFRVGERHAPVSAVDGEGEDVLPALAEADHRYVSDLRPGPYQGVVEPHGIILELPPDLATSEPLRLFLRGWIFPTDASINVALAQREDLAVDPPRLEVPDGEGGWREVIPDVGFPAGKDKTIVVDLTGKVPTGDPRIRIRTNMQIYWDHAFFADGGAAGVEHRVRRLRPVSADLHYRGFSREYRRGGRHGPHWFDYDVVDTLSPWLPIPGRYTRYGDVLPLLRRSDDRYVVMAPGDETTVSFDAGAPAALPDGWVRTFLLYTVGWIKDADLNTATGDRVGPLPFHGQTGYPHPPGETYPSDPEHLEFLRRYQSRTVPGSTLRLAPDSSRWDGDSAPSLRR